MTFYGKISSRGARLSIVGLLLGLVAISLAACGGGDATPTPTAAPTVGLTINDATPTAQTGAAGGASEIAATLNEWSVSLNADQVAAGQVKFTVTNEGQFAHDLAIVDSGGNQLGAVPVFENKDGAKELVVELKPGTYTIVCDVPGHTAQGMTTNLIVK